MKNNLQEYAKPAWLRKPIFYSDLKKDLVDCLHKNKVRTICEEGRCPNRSECYHRGTATFLIMGEMCTRSCRFCSVQSASAKMIRDGLLPALDKDEPNRIARVVQQTGLRYVVLTSVDRDDLPDYGANHFSLTIKAIHAISSNILVEVLTPDFKGDSDCIQQLLMANPCVYNHNVETVERLSRKVRRKSSYEISLDVLRKVKQINPQAISKSGVMIGLGETFEELNELFEHLAEVDCDILTIGQYLQPTNKNIQVQNYLAPDGFEQLRYRALEKGIPVVCSGPFVRSSYRADASYYEVQALRAKS